MTRTAKGINAQLRAFYDKQGLTGQHRRKALQYDRRAIHRACVSQCGTPYEPVGDGCLLTAFVWEQTPEGVAYWMERDAWEAEL